MGRRARPTRHARVGGGLLARGVAPKGARGDMRASDEAAHRTTRHERRARFARGARARCRTEAVARSTRRVDVMLPSRRST